MSARDFASDAGKKRLTEAVARAETQTSAEIVIAIRRAASRHLKTSFGFALLATVAAFVVWWFSPTPYDPRYMPLELAVAFGLAFYLAASIDPLRRELTPMAVRRNVVARASSAAFDTLGVRATRGRTGVLVYVALFERDVAIVPDEGIDPAVRREDVRPIEGKLRAAIVSRDLEAFARAIESLGELYGVHHPRSENDENELCDAPH